MIHSHYDNLQVSRNASEKVIRAAYRTLASTYHPDKSTVPPAEADRIMKLLNEAHAVLMDPASRLAHDEWIKQRESDATSLRESQPAPRPKPSSPPQPPRSSPASPPPMQPGARRAGWEASPPPPVRPGESRLVRMTLDVWLVGVCAIAVVVLFLSITGTSSAPPLTPSQSYSNLLPPTSDTTPASSGTARCKGSYEPEKCEAFEKKLAAEAPEQRTQRQTNFEADRVTNMKVVASAPSDSARCKGSYEPAKCEAQERQLASETPETRLQRQTNLEDERVTNMNVVVNPTSRAPKASAVAPQQ